VVSIQSRKFARDMKEYEEFSREVRGGEEACWTYRKLRSSQGRVLVGASVRALVFVLSTHAKLPIDTYSSDWLDRHCDSW
jgi:hypothetical protein